MTQEEIIKLAQEAGFENYAYEAVGIFERFARLVSAAEREKFTNTQEFVTLPREVVEQALEALNGKQEALRQFAVYICELAGLPLPAVEEGEAAQSLRAALERPQVEQEPVAWIWTEWSNRKLTFDGPPAVPSVRDELTKPVWTPLYTRPQPPVVEQPIAEVIVSHVRSGLDGRYTAEVAGYERLSVGAELFVRPQPPNTEQSSAVEQHPAEQEPGYLDGGSRYKVTHLKTSGYCIIGLPGELLGCWVALVDATDNKHIDGPQPKREPLTDEQIDACFPVQWEGDFYQPWRKTVARAIEAAHNIK